MRFLKIVWLFFFFTPQALALNLYLSFSQENKTYYWNNWLDYNQKFGRKTELGFFTTVNSTLIKKPFQESWQDNGELRFNLNYALRENLKVGALLTQNINSFEKSKVRITDYLGEANLLLKKIKLTQQIGVKRRVSNIWQKEEKEQGMEFNTQISLKPWADFLPLELSLNQSLINLKNFPSIERNLRVFYSKSFSLQESLSINYWEGWAKKRYLEKTALSDYNEQKRINRELKTEIFKKALWEVKLDFTYDLLLDKKNYQFQTIFKNNAMTSHNLNFVLKKEFSQSFSVETFYRYLRTDEDYYDSTRNQKMESGEIGARLNLKLTQKDSLNFFGTVGVTSFLAEAKDFNYNDRDIMTRILNIEAVHIFGPNLTLQVWGGFRLFHQLYISRFLSANNNNNQTYLLSPIIFWKISEQIKIRQSYQLQANYIFYDYEKEKESPKNTIFRRAVSTSEISYALSPRVTFLTSYAYNYEDYGQLIWRDQWTQRPSTDTKIQTFNFGLDYSPYRKLTISPRLTYEQRRKYDHTLDPFTLAEARILGEKLVRNLIYCGIYYRIAEKSFFKFDFSERVQKWKSGVKDKTDSFYITLLRYY
jgi:hypothetical protein